MTTKAFDILKPPTELHFGCEDAQAVWYDWAENHEDWEAYEAEHLDCSDFDHVMDCPDCDGSGDRLHEAEDGDDITGMERCGKCEGSGEVPCDFDGYVVASFGLLECPKCGQETETYSDGPLMGYYYPLPDHKTFSPSDALELQDVALCLVYFRERGEWALALTGGGMDMSWDIAQAHMRLGLLPPMHACNLPRFAGMNLTAPVAAWVIAGCRRTCEAVANHATRRLEDLDRLIIEGEA